ncbi:outer membrane beta-barrel protein [Helicobacter pylori]|nr:outer membrane beta-barrel protein [Helicobacter pylori]
MLLKFCFSSASQSFRIPILGVNAKIGYQNYFNDFIGLAYYGIIKYNYAKASSEKVQQLSYGGGVELLVDFITAYSNKNRGLGDFNEIAERNIISPHPLKSFTTK